MSRYHVVTTMNADGWKTGGDRMARSLIERWPMQGVTLTVYAEGFSPDANIYARRLPAWLDAFKTKHGGDPIRNGRRNGGYDFRWDAVKFAHKIAALTDFAKDMTEGTVIWIDADTYTHADVTLDWLDALFPGNGYMAILDRARGGPETGFMMFRCGHTAHKQFMRQLERLYTSGSLFKMAEWMDAYVIDQLASTFVRQGLMQKPTSLSGDVSWHHPFVNGPLGSRLDHLKGPRKDRGKSDRRDLKTMRQEPYWQGAR